MNWFYLIFPGMFIPLFLMASFAKIYPTGRTALFILLPIFFASLFFCVDATEPLWMVGVLDGVLFIVLGFDFLRIVGVKNFQAKRSVERIASLAIVHQVRLRIENKTDRAHWVQIRDDLLPEFSLIVSDSPNSFRKNQWDDEELFQHKKEKKRLIPQQMSEEIQYQLFPNKRGSFRLEYVYLTVFSLCGCWKKMLKIRCESEILVYPNLRQISQYELLARSQRLHQLGFRKTRRIGVDHDFERLRDYTNDDQYKFIDWQATAKRNRLTVKDFQMTRNQRIIFMIDAGRMMTNLSDISTAEESSVSDSFASFEKTSEFPNSSSSHFKRPNQKISLLDYSFNAMLMLAYIALKQGDEVGFLCFSNRVRQYIPPRSGLNSINRLIHGSFDLFPEPVESRYDLAFSWLSERCRKRSLVVFITNVNDDRNATQIETHLTNLVGRHLPLGIFIRDHAIFKPIEQYEAIFSKESLILSDSSDSFNRPDLKNSWETTDFSPKQNDSVRKIILQKNPDLFYRAAAASEILNGRHKTLRELSAKGTMTLDVFPEQITTSLINKYLEIKARRLL